MHSTGKCNFSRNVGVDEQFSTKEVIVVKSVEDRKLAQKHGRRYSTGK